MENVIISIKGTQNLGNADDDSIELVTDGEFSRRNGVSQFSYMESELTGLEGTKTTFEVMSDQVVLTREGSVNSQMVFQRGKKHYFAYDTPFGATTMGVETHSLSDRLGEKGGDLEIHYVIDMDSVVISRNMFKINIREVNGIGKPN